MRAGYRYFGTAVPTPGATLLRNGGYGAANWLSIRGADTDQTVVVIDGAKLNDPSPAGRGNNEAGSRQTVSARAALGDKHGTLTRWIGRQSFTTDGILAIAPAFDGKETDGNYTWTISEDQSPGAVNLGKWLPRRPRETGNGSISCEWRFGLTTGAAIRWANHNFDNASNAQRLEAYTLVDLRAEYCFSLTFRFAIGVLGRPTDDNMRGTMPRGSSRC